MDVTDQAMERHLGSLGLEVRREAEVLRITCPTFRPDLEREVDLIEEVGRLFGYDSMPATLPPLRAAPASSGDRLVEAVRDALVAAGLDEAITSGSLRPSGSRRCASPAATRPTPLAPCW
jgi:phenylalanyl-tRNA synthetase beta chain